MSHWSIVNPHHSLTLTRKTLNGFRNKPMVAVVSQGLALAQRIIELSEIISRYISVLVIRSCQAQPWIVS